MLEECRSRIECDFQIVMDEADMLLDESFSDSLTEIFSRIPVAHSETNTLSADRGVGACCVLYSILYTVL